MGCCFDVFDCGSGPCVRQWRGKKVGLLGTYNIRVFIMIYMNGWDLDLVLDTITMDSPQIGRNCVSFDHEIRPTLP